MKKNPFEIAYTFIKKDLYRFLIKIKNKIMKNIEKIVILIFRKDFKTFKERSISFFIFFFNFSIRIIILIFKMPIKLLFIFLKTIITIFYLIIKGICLFFVDLIDIIERDLELKKKIENLEKKTYEKVETIVENYLSKLSKSELRDIYLYLYLDSYNSPKSLRYLSKIDLVDSLKTVIAHKPLKFYEILKKLGKEDLAENYFSELRSVEEEYEKEKESILSGYDVKNVENMKKDNNELNKIVDEITSAIASIYSLSDKPMNELQFQNQIEAFLRGLLQNQNKKFKLYREYRFSTDERIDFLIKYNTISIGLEVKYDLNDSSNFHRLLGQLETYLKHLDALIIVSYNFVNNRKIQELLERRKSKNKIIKIILPKGRVL